jgi:RNA polymerase sigma factor for flagellar operon FliA
MPIAVLHLEDLPTHERKEPDEHAEASSPLEALANKRIADLLRRELAGLPERDRLVLHLHYFKGMRLREIGRFLGISEARVSQIHHRALRQLRPRLSAAA